MPPQPPSRYHKLESASALNDPQNNPNTSMGTARITNPTLWVRAAISHFSSTAFRLITCQSVRSR